VAAKVPRTMVEVGVRRGGQTVVLKVELGERPLSAIAQTNSGSAQCDADLSDNQIISALINYLNKIIDSHNMDNVNSAKGEVALLRGLRSG
jgi:hypothetical protein